MTELEKLKEKGEAPEWLTEEGFAMLSGGYLQQGETPKKAYERVSSVVASDLNRSELSPVFFDMIWKNWLCPSSPVLSNTGTKNLQISCFSGTPLDDTYDIMRHVKELVMLTKYGGGVGSSFDSLRPRGSKISRGGTTDGIVPFLKTLEAAIDGTRQGSTRRGAVASYLSMNHGDIEEFIDIRKSSGDPSRRCLTKSFHNAVTINDETMNRIVESKGRDRDLWNKLMTTRVETGEPYIMFTDNANKNCPEAYKGRITHSNLCSEIMAPITNEETFVCCLSSVNALKFDEWKDWKCSKTGKDFIELCIYFLDGVLTGFINQAKGLRGLENAVRFAENHRLLGLGVLGWHSLLQSKDVAFDSYNAMVLNAELFGGMRRSADRATEDLAKEFGECKETKGTGRRNTCTIAIAPTASNAVLSGGLSQGIEPITANLFVQKGAKGNFIKKNPLLLQKLIKLNKDTSEVWEQINLDKGSVRNLKFLSDEEKEIFATEREINQHAIIKQSAQRQRWIDQASSINLFFSLPASKSDAVKVAKYMNEVHLEAWRSGVKSLYYLKTDSPIKGELIYRDSEECKACEG